MPEPVKPPVGARVRIVETYPDGTTVTAEGVVAWHQSSENPIPIGDPQYPMWWHDIDDVKVTVTDPAVKPPTYMQAIRSNGQVALWIHGCGAVDWWNAKVHGPINEQGCDACESAPDGTWRPLYVQEAAAGQPSGSAGEDESRG